jgi:hypothetical protein
MLQKILCLLGYHKTVGVTSKYVFQGVEYFILNKKRCEKCGCEWKLDKFVYTHKSAIQ